MGHKPDLFHRMMALPVVRPLHPLYRKCKEPLLYLFFCGLTTLLSIALFWVLTQPMHIPALAANAVDWIICVLFAYLTNRAWVFQDKAQDAKGILREWGAFFLGRIGTLVMEEIVLWLGIDLLEMSSMPIKVFAQVLVVAGNYVISKWMVFTSRA